MRCDWCDLEMDGKFCSETCTALELAKGLGERKAEKRIAEELKRLKEQGYLMTKKTIDEVCNQDIK